MIQGSVLGLRAIEREDLQLLKQWRNIPSLRKNFREFRELNNDNQENWFARVNSSTNDFMFMIERLADKKPIGACGLLYVNWIIRSADFSFYIGDEGKYIDDQGYADEASSLLINYGFKTLNLHKIWMELYEFDTTKINFFTKRFGFKIDGVLRDNCFDEGRYWNSSIISLISKDWN